MKKKCKECGDIYETEDQKIVLKINHKDIEALEDVLFVQLTEKESLKLMPKIRKIWKQICKGEEKWEERN